MSTGTALSPGTRSLGTEWHAAAPNPSTSIWADPAVLASWTVNNLDSYWRRWLDRATSPASKLGLYALSAAATVWVVTA